MTKNFSWDIEAMAQGYLEMAQINLELVEDFIELEAECEVE
ncbi:MAG: hypothetical protein ACOX05_00230 [Bacillota bacterium]|jgi:hypothetical protein